MNHYFHYYFHQRGSEMSYTLANSVSGCLLDWLSDNSRNPYTPKNNKRSKAVPLLMQSFKSAGREFAAIDAPTRAVIVPYGKGQELIAELCGAWDAKEMRRTLAQAQRYSVNVFPNVWERLQKAQAVRETLAGSGIYYLDERHYHEAYGLCIDEAGEMMFYDL